MVQVTESRYPKLAFTLVLFATLLVLLGLNIAFNAVERSHESTLKLLTGMSEVKSEVLYLDEKLTDLAVRYTLTRDENYYFHYREDAYRLEELLNTLRRHEIREIREAASALTAANNKMVAVETESFAKAKEGRPKQGYDLLNGEKYRGLKAEYSAGAWGLASFVDGEIEKKIEMSAEKRLWRTAVVSVIMVALIGIWLWFLSMFAAWREKLEYSYQELDRRVEERTKELEEERQLRMMNAKLAAVGELAANIAHEINNPLQIVALRAQQVLDIADEKESKPLMDLGDSLLKTTRRLTKIANGLRSLSRDGSLENITAVNVDNFLSDIVEVFEPRFLSVKIKFEKINQVGSKEAYFRPTQISQVLMNLMNNAVDAVAKIEDRRIILGAESLDEAIDFYVRDSGRGVSPEIIDRIMQPFFTTKPFGEGTGLGLSISKELVKNHRGRINYSRVDNMTEFRITLPQDFQVQRASVSRGKVVIS